MDIQNSASIIPMESFSKRLPVTSGTYKFKMPRSLNYNRVVDFFFFFSKISETKYVTSMDNSAS